MSSSNNKNSSSSAPKSQQLPFYKHVLAGGIAGVSEICVMYPLDVVKTRAQLSTDSARQGIIPTLVKTVKEDGLRTYRGILSPIMVEAPKRAVKFAANDFYKKLYQNKDPELTQNKATLAGISAGLSEAFLVVPFELVKIRLQAKENLGVYKNTFDAVAKILSQEGPLALFQGLEPTLWRHGLWNGGYFGLIFTLKANIPEADTYSGNLLRNFVAGSIAGTFGTMLNTPPDVVKTRIQNYRPSPGNPVNKYRWTLPSAMTIAREEGVRALWRGFVPKVLRLGPGGGILLVVYEMVASFLLKHQKS
eukprot:gb/GECH01003083.1/.p1 GENE.gb/GECH01003083.1/~~gb/GECH01003083.1/.p1  ORF type:complete len:305 (+),score=60.99 gb/GECH01003083.1/:1-915(+)